MDIDAFRIRFGEFDSAPDLLVQACLDEAAAETSAEAFGDGYDAAHGQLAAHKLAVSPWGQNARMVNDKGESTYGTERTGIEGRLIVPLTVV